MLDRGAHARVRGGRVGVGDRHRAVHLLARGRPLGQRLELHAVLERRGRALLDRLRRVPDDGLVDPPVVGDAVGAGRLVGHLEGLEEQLPFSTTNWTVCDRTVPGLPVCRRDDVVGDGRASRYAPTRAGRARSRSVRPSRRPCRCPAWPGRSVTVAVGDGVDAGRGAVLDHELSGGRARAPGIGFGEIAKVAPGTEVPNWSTLLMTSFPHVGGTLIPDRATKSRSDDFSSLTGEGADVHHAEGAAGTGVADPLSKALRLTAASAKSPSALVAPAKPAPAMLAWARTSRGRGVAGDAEAADAKAASADCRPLVGRR